MSSQVLLSGGDKWYSYSGEIFGDITAPATIQMILIPNTGLKDSVVQIQPYFGKLVSGNNGQALGISVKLDDVTVINSQSYYIQSTNYGTTDNAYRLFVPRQSKLEILRLNATDNNTQISGVNVIGYYL